MFQEKYIPYDWRHICQHCYVANRSITLLLLYLAARLAATILNATLSSFPVLLMICVAQLWFHVQCFVDLSLDIFTFSFSKFHCLYFFDLRFLIINLVPSNFSSSTNRLCVCYGKDQTKFHLYIISSQTKCMVCLL